MLAFVIMSCGYLENTSRKLVSENYFLIAPDSILKSLDQGEEKAFSPINSDGEQGELYPFPIDWGQSDYLQIVNALHNYVWRESIDDWKLSYMAFTLPCGETGNGLQSGSFSFYKEKMTLEGISEVEHQIDIYPKMKLISTWEYTYKPKLLRWKSVDFTKIALTADEALLIAESNGGLNKRTVINNACDISIILSPNSANYLGWKVLYSPDVFSISIDINSGQIID